MLKINYPSNKDEFDEAYIKALGIDDDMRGEFLQLISINTINKFKINSLDDILLAPFEDLLKISFSSSVSTNAGGIKSFFNYSNMQPKIKSFFEKHLDMKTCYFCNLDFINSFNDIDDYHDFSDFAKRATKEDLMEIKGVDEKKARKENHSSLMQESISKNDFANLKKKYSHFTLDHILDKSTYPLIALSLYNFVPSCYACNVKFKRSKKLFGDPSMSYLSPTSNNFSFDEDVKFKLYFHNGKNKPTINSKNDFILDFFYHKNESEYQKYIDIFKLKGRYIFHKDEVVNLVRKKKQYSQSQIKEISNTLNLSTSQVKKDIFGKELFEENNAKMSMTKFKKDIAKDIGIL